jgi:hypothetical protein
MMSPILYLLALLSITSICLCPKFLTANQQDEPRLLEPAQQLVLENEKRPNLTTFVPIGVYTYLSILKENAISRGLKLDEYISMFLSMSSKGGINTVFLGNTGGQDEEIANIATFVSIAKKYGIYVVLQPTGAYFATKANGKESDAAVNTKMQNIRERGLSFIAKAKEHKLFDMSNLLALSLREELKNEFLPQYLEYVRQVRNLLPSTPLYMLFNSTKTTRSMPVGIHSKWGIDYYPFSVEGRTGKQIAAGNALDNYLNQARKRIEAGSHFNIAPWMVLQGSATIRPAQTSENIPRLLEGDLVISKYLPPVGGISGQFWSAFMAGGRGFFLFYAPSRAYPNQPTKKKVIYGTINPDLSSDYRWEEYIDVASHFTANQGLLSSLEPIDNIKVHKKEGLAERIYKSGQGRFYWLILNTQLVSREFDPLQLLQNPGRKDQDKIHIPADYVFGGQILPLTSGVEETNCENKLLSVRWHGGDAILVRLTSGAVQ